jgi:Ca2+-binding RTX toxin-like protein
LNGGDGNDTFIFASADQIAAVDGGGHTSSDSIEFSVNVDLSDDLAFADVTRVERLVLADGPNTVTLDAAASDAGIYIVMGNASDDVIELTIGYGSDSNLIGGAGDDTFMFAAVSQIATVDGGAHSDGDVIVLTVDGVTLSDADLTDVTNVEGLVTANGANTVTLGVDAQAAGIVSVTGGDGSDSIDLNGYTVNTFLFGGAGSDDIWGGLASDEITGGTGNDDIFGDEGDDTIFGADVGDTIDGGLGSDSLVLSDDYTSASDENLQDLEIVEVADSVTVGVTIDLSVQSSDEMFSIYGGISDDKITGGLGEDHIFAGDGNDTIYGLAGEDYVDGGSDTTGDTLVLTSAADDWNAWSVSDDQIVNIEVIDLSAHSDGADLDLSNQTEGFTIDGSASDDTIVGGSGADSIYGAGGSDDLTGGAGSDDLYGGLGDDMLTGGSDNDTFYVESGSDTITDLTTGDAFVVSASDATAVGLVDGVFETFEFLVDPYIPGGDGPKTFSFDGTDIQFSDGESMDSSSNLIAAASFANWTVEDLGLSVRFTAKAAGNVDVSISDFTYTDNRAPSTIKQFSNNTQGSGTSEFVATSSTTNAGTAYLYGGDEDDTLFDLSLAGGPNGYHLFGGSDSLLGADTLIGSNFDDVINGGNDIQLNSDAADVLVGGLGADQFVFNTFNSTPVDLSFSDSTAPFDEELISYSVSGETDEGTETLTIKWSLNGTPQTDVQIQAVGINVASALSVQTAIASKLNALSSVFAEVDGTVKVHGGDDLIGDLNAITIVEIQQTGGGWTTGAFSDENGTDIAQITDLTIGGGTLTTNEIYTLTGNLAANTSIGASYTVLDGDTSQDIAEGLATAFNIGHSDDVLAAAFSDAGVWHVSFTDQNADDGGFTLADVTSGAYGGSGASSNGAADIALADVIMDFSDAEGDTISFGLGIAVSDDFQAALTPATDYADALADAGLAMNSVLKYYFTADSTDGYLFFDANQDGLVDGVVKLAGVTDLNSVHYTDII